MIRKGPRNHMSEKIPSDVNKTVGQKPGPTHPPTEDELSQAVAELQRAGVFGPNPTTRGPLWIGDY
jgi:hypothetical protein